MSSLRIGITDYVAPPFDLEAEACRDVLGADVTLVALDTPEHAAPEPAKLADLDALLVWHATIDAATAKALDRCKIVVRYGVGFDAIDIPALAAKGIPFSNTPDYGTEEVADTACAMTLALQRKIRAYDLACRTYPSGWQEHVQPPLTRTNTCTLGVVGVGRIGTAVINRLRPFGYRIVGYDPHQPSGHEKAVGYHRAKSLEELLGDADMVTLHCPLGENTRGMVNSTFLDAMKPGASLVNTARGGLIDGLDGLEAALRSGKLASAALDVLPEEPPGDHPLIQAWREDAPWLSGRLLINPHSAYYSESAWREMRYKAAETAALALRDGTLRNRITS